MKISILGCGWLGLPLAKKLAEEGYQIKGSATSSNHLKAIEQTGTQPFIIRLAPHLIGETDFFDSEYLVINFPPERREDIESYLATQIQSLTETLQKTPVKKVLFVSSTSVYPAINKEVKEEDAHPGKKSGKALLHAEKVLRAQPNFDVTVIRFSGLIGYDRLPGRFLAGKKDVKNGDAPVNLIHRDDCLRILEQIIKSGLWGQTYNACSPQHPKRKDFYTKAARKAGTSIPTFDDTSETQYKIVNSDKLISDLNFQFHYPDPMQCI